MGWSSPVALHVALPVALALAGCAAAVSTPVRVPVSSPTSGVSPGNTRMAAHAIDTALEAEWAKGGIAPAPRVDDARFMRRVYLDVVGTIPTPDEIAAFLADTRPADAKRAALVDKLLASPRYAEHWATYWDAELMGRETRSDVLDRNAFHSWLRASFAANTPWDKLVFALVSATGQNSNGGPRQKAPAMWGAGAGAGANAEADREPVDVGINPAVNYLLRFRDAPQDLAGTTSRQFLGVQIQCAQCHDHKTEAWKQTDFQSFASCFARTQTIPLDVGKTMGQIRRVEVRDVRRAVPRFTKDPELAPIAAQEPRALDGTDMGTGEDARWSLAAWIVSKQNPYFARAIVNRMWGHFLGRGFVDPVDDLRPSNEPVMPALFDSVAHDFSANGYDLKALIRLITASEAYALAPAPATKSDPENKTWSRFRLVPLGPEELLSAIFTATNVEEVARRAGRGGNLDQVRAQLFRQYGFLFDVDEDTDQKDFEGSVTQALTLVNGTLVDLGTSAVPGGALADILSHAKDDRGRIEALYLRALGRAPNADEMQHGLAFVNERVHADAALSATATATTSPAEAALVAKPRQGGGGDALRAVAEKGRRGWPRDPQRSAYEDMFWALLNSSEFLFNH